MKAVLSQTLPTTGSRGNTFFWVCVCLFKIFFFYSHYFLVCINNLKAICEFDGCSIDFYIMSCALFTFLCLSHTVCVLCVGWGGEYGGIRVCMLPCRHVCLCLCVCVSVCVCVYVC